MKLEIGAIGMKIAYVIDPEGNQIEVCCPLDEN